LSAASVAPSQRRTGVASAAWLSARRPVDQRLENHGGVSGASPCRFTTISTRRPGCQRLGAAFGAIARSGSEVITTSAPKASRVTDAGVIGGDDHPSKPATAIAARQTVRSGFAPFAGRAPQFASGLPG
jgi:hypothetical protein